MLYIDNRIFDSISFNYVSFKYAVGVLRASTSETKRNLLFKLLFQFCLLASLSHTIYICLNFWILLRPFSQMAIENPLYEIVDFPLPRYRMVPLSPRICPCSNDQLLGWEIWGQTSGVSENNCERTPPKNKMCMVKHDDRQLSFRVVPFTRNPSWVPKKVCRENMFILKNLRNFLELLGIRRVKPGPCRGFHLPCNYW